MDYPQGFPAESRAKVEAAKIRAGREFDSMRTKVRWKSEIEALFWTYVLTPFLVFAREAYGLRLWTIDKMDQNCREFLRRLAIAAYYEKGKAAGLSDMIDNFSCDIRWEAEQVIQKTSQWRKYENILLKFAVKGHLGKGTTEVPSASPGVEGSNREVQSAWSKTGEGLPASIAAFRATVLQRTGKRIAKKDIWIMAGYNDATEFERFQRNDPRTTETAKANFHRVLGMEPDEFIRNLETRRAQLTKTR